MRDITAISQFLWILFFITTFSWVKSTTDTPVGFPCEKIPNFCDRVTCAPPKNCDNGIIVKGAGNCGCCEACITYREIGDECSPGVVEVPAKLPDGVIAQYYEDDRCHPGLECSATFYCQPLSSTASAGFKECSYHEYECKENQWEGKPSCDFYGDYSSKSCKGSSNPRCYCVDEKGQTIFGRLPVDKVANATCACSRAISKTDKPLSDFIRCDETGDFMPLQCWGHVCFCIDPITKLMTSEAVPIAGIKALSCWDSKLYNATYYTPCTSEYLRQSGIIKEQSLKGMTIYPLDLPNCDPDGTYDFKQYDSNAYFCSDREGAQIASYSSQEYVNYQAMVCNCARDAKYSEGLPDSGRGYKCDSNGNYVPMYCNQDQCFCLDSDGQQSSSTFTSDPKINCKDAMPTFPPGFQMDGWTKSIWMEQEPID